MAKGKKVEKETRRLIEGISDLVKKKGDRYKFKTKNKKEIKKIIRRCPHWIIRKGKEQPIVINDPERPENWKCLICNASFPIKPAKIIPPTKDDPGYNTYHAEVAKMLALVNQIQFWGVKLGGDADDTKMFLRLKADLPRFKKVADQIIKQVNKRQALENNRENSNVLDQFNAYAGFNYNV